jgi:hypothetical protein
MTGDAAIELALKCPECDNGIWGGKREFLLFGDTHQVFKDKISRCHNGTLKWLRKKCTCVLAYVCNCSCSRT